jgi:hypothetical protein
MPTNKINQQSRQVGVRLPHDVDEQVTAYALAHQLSHGQAMIQLIRKGLTGRETPLDTCETPMPWERFGAVEEAVAVLAERLSKLEVSNGVVDGVSNEDPGYDASIFRLGKLCKHGHRYNGTGKSLRYRKSGACPTCAVLDQQGRRAPKATAAVEEAE